MTTQTYVGTLIVHHCINCGVPYGMTEEYEARRREDHEWFYCPNGHSAHYPHRNRVELLEKRLQLAEGEAQQNRERYQRERASRISTKGHVTRLRRKVAAGKCPCCKREFPDLAEHMKWKHPNFAGQEA